MDEHGQPPSACNRAAVQSLGTQLLVAARPVHARRRQGMLCGSAKIYRPFFRLLERARSMLRGCTERPNFLRTLSARPFARRLLSAARS